MTVTLHQFAFSHFNEKARWALAFKGVEHQRKTYLPGPHMPTIRKLSGQTQTPVLQTETDIIPGSAAIIEYLDNAVPAPPLLPEDVERREHVVTLQQEMDAELGPAVRTVVFAAFLKDVGYIAKMFAGNKSLPVRLSYRASLPLVKGIIAKGNGADDPANVVRCNDLTHTWLDRLSDLRQEQSYLVGDSFSTADLTAAALLAPIAQVDHPDMQRPQPIPQAVQQTLQAFADHPTLEWVRTLYHQHRPT